jgi:peptidoglycan hydrolase-like protein with peptidoglycan-binding domain
LNQILGLQLRVSGVMNRATRDALRDFQKQEGLPVDGIAGPETEKALIETKVRQPGDTKSLSSELEDREALDLAEIFTTKSLEAHSEFNEYDDELLKAFSDLEEEDPFEEFDDESEQERETDEGLEGEVGLKKKLRNWWVQGWLNVILGTSLKLNGILDKPTRNAIREFQRRKGLTVDGIVGPRTERAFIATGAFPRYGSPEYVRWVQGFLNQILKIRLRIDGIEGPKTNSAIRTFQRRHGLKVDGVVGPETEKVLMEVGCKRFFEEYEVRFNPGDPNFGRGVPNKDLREEDVLKMVEPPSGLLLRRRDMRAEAALKNKIPSFAPVSTAQKNIANRLSRAQLDLFREFFPDRRGKINFHPFQRCFEKFANGELRRGANGIGEPDGGFYFLFAEFAFLCIELGISVELWTEGLRVFVKTQEIFMHVYRPNPVSPPPVDAPVPACPGTLQGKPRPRIELDDYSFGNFRKVGRLLTMGKGQSNLKRKVALRAKYDQMSLIALTKATRNNMLRAQCMK